MQPELNIFGLTLQTFGLMLGIAFIVCGALTAAGSDLIVVAPPGSNAARLLGLVAMSDIGEVRGSLADALDRCSGRRETT